VKNKIEKKSGDGQTFYSFLKQKTQKRELIVLVGVYLVLYFLMLYFYPFPNGISDSGGYVLSASQDKYLGYRPFGYSWFLIFLHHLSCSIHFVVIIQAFLNMIGTLFFIFSVHYFFKIPGKLLRVLFDGFVVASLVVVYLTNTILSDSIFTSLTLLWVTFGLWFIFTEKLFAQLLFFTIQCILLIFLIKVRYTGLFYIGIEAMLIFFNYTRQKRFVGASLLMVVIILTVHLYQNQVKLTDKVIGIKVFSGFSGWQAANNALHAVPYIDIDLKKIKGNEVKEFASFVKNNDSLLVLPSFYASGKFLWDKKLPLKQFLTSQIQSKKWTYVKTWTYLGKNVYSKFGSYVITHHPVAFARYYLIPNFLGTVYPVNDQLYVHYNPMAIPEDLLEKWFEIKKGTEISPRNDWVGIIARSIPIWRLVITVAMIVSILYLLIVLWRRKGLFSTIQLKMFWFVLLFTLGYFAFNVYASPFELRYIAPVHAFQVLLVVLGVRFLFHSKTEIK